MRKITEHNRAESNAQVDIAKRYAQIISILRNGDMTAKEVAVEMFNRGYVSSSERNNSAPRLTELVAKNRVVAVNKRKCQYTGKTVTVYSLVDNNELGDK